MNLQHLRSCAVRVFSAAILITIFAAGGSAWSYSREEKSELVKRIQNLRKEVAETTLEYGEAKKASWELYLKTVKGAGKSTEEKIEIIRASDPADQFEKKTNVKLLELQA